MAVSSHSWLADDHIRGLPVKSKDSSIERGISTKCIWIIVALAHEFPDEHMWIWHETTVFIYIYMGFHHSNHCEHAWARRPHVHQGEKSTEAMVKQLAWFLTGQRPIGTSHEKHPINCWMMIVPRPKHISPGNVGELCTYWPIWIYYLDNDIFDILHNGDIEYGYIHNDLFWSQMSISAETFDDFKVN